MACSKVISFTMLAAIIFLSPPTERFALAVRTFKTDSPDILNFGFPELSPPAPRIPFLPPKNELEPYTHDIPTSGSSEFSPPAPEVPSSYGIPNFGFPELSPPAPEIPFLPPKNELEPYMPSDPNSEYPEFSPPSLAVPGSSGIPNFGFPELSPPAPRIPFLPPDVPNFPPKIDLLAVSKTKSKPPSPAVTKSPKKVPRLGRDIGSPVPSRDGSESQEAN